MSDIQTTEVGPPLQEDWVPYDPLADQPKHKKWQEVVKVGGELGVYECANCDTAWEAETGPQNPCPECGSIYCHRLC